MRFFKHLLFFEYDWELEGEGKAHRFHHLPRISTCLLLLFTLTSLFSCWFIVDRDENSVILQFGKHVRTVEPGLHFKLPWPIETATEVTVTKVLRQEIGFRTVDPGPPAVYEPVPEESDMLTGDLNLIELEFIIQYVSSDAPKWLFQVVDPDKTLGLLTQSSMRFIVGHSTFDQAATSGRAEIQVQTEADLKMLTDKVNFGARVVKVQLQDAHPPKGEVHEAFRDVTNAREDKQKAIRSAEAYANDVVPKARGQAAKLLRAAEAYRDQRVALATGEAARFLSVYEQYRLAPEITLQRMQFEAIGELLPGRDQLINLDSTGVLKWLDVNNLRKGGGQ